MSDTPTDFEKELNRILMRSSPEVAKLYKKQIMEAVDKHVIGEYQGTFDKDQKESASSNYWQNELREKQRQYLWGNK